MSDALERVATTVIQVVIAYVATDPFRGDNAWRAVLTVAVIALAQAIKVFLTTWLPVISDWRLDVAYRAASTFVVTFAGAYVSAEWLDIVSSSFAEEAALAGAAAALAVVKGVIAVQRGGATITPASLVKIP